MTKTLKSAGASRASDSAFPSDEPIPSPEPLVYDSASLCRVLRISLATLHRLKSAGKLPRARKLGALLRWDACEIRAWIAAGMPNLKTWEALRSAGSGR